MIGREHGEFSFLSEYGGGAFGSGGRIGGKLLEREEKILCFEVSPFVGLWRSSGGFSVSY